MHYKGFKQSVTKIFYDYYIIQIAYNKQQYW